MPDPCIVSSPRIQLDLVPSGGVDALTADVILSASAEQGLTLNEDGLWASRGPIVVGSMPAAPTDGMDRYLVSGDVLWHVRRYSNKWYLVGGPPLQSADPGGDAGASFAADSGNAWHLQSGGPTITAPYAGAYLAEWGGHVQPPGVGDTVRLGISVNSANPSQDAHCGYGGAPGSGVSGSGIASVSRAWPLNLTANDVLKLSGWTNGSSGTVNITHRWLKLTPRTLT